MTNELNIRLRELRLSITAAEREVGKRKYQNARGHMLDAFDLQLARVRELLAEEMAAQKARADSYFSSRRSA